MSDKTKLIIPLIVGVCLTIGLYLGKYLYQKPEVNTVTVSQTNKIMSVLDLIRNKYVDSVDENDLVDQTITEMLAKLDPHSAYIPPVNVDLARESIEGKFEGIGVRFIIHKDTLGVTHVLPNSPSNKVGLQRGDRILEVDTLELSTVKITNNKVMELLKGPAGTQVKLVIKRGEKILNKIITRGSVARTSIASAQMLDDQVGYIQLSEFSFTAYTEFNSSIARLKQGGMKKLILDLRNNGGGLLHIANQILDEFLDSGKLIVYTEGTHAPRQETRATAFGNMEQMDLVILVNENSASASEIVAGAIQDNDRGLIIGRRSFGKGLVQQPINLKDGSELRLTIARYYTPTGRSIQKSYAQGFDAYHLESYDRMKNGELYEIDSTLFVDSLKYTTPGGKVVYGGGGIMPDIFIPIDTSNYTGYLGELRYNDVFNHFAYDFANAHRKEWSNAASFVSNFKLTPALIKSFKNYAVKFHNVRHNEDQFNRSVDRIKLRLKADIARHLFDENAFYKILSIDDKEIQTGIKSLK